MAKKRIIVLVGPSGSGKTTIGKELTKRGVPKLITTTTRLPRPGEKHGVDYYFRKAEELDPGDFVEQTIYNDRMYGLTKSEVKSALEKSDVVHVSLDRNGSRAVKDSFPEEARVVFIQVSLETIEKRMRKRGDKEKKILERITHSQKTNELIPPQETDLVVENTEVSRTVEEIMTGLNIIL